MTRGPAGYREVGCATISFCDEDGEMISAIRMARMPEPNEKTLKASILAELGAVLAQVTQSMKQSGMRWGMVGGQRATSIQLLRLASGLATQSGTKSLFQSASGYANACNGSAAVGAGALGVLIRKNRVSNPPAVRKRTALPADGVVGPHAGAGGPVAAATLPLGGDRLSNGEAT